jgi:hypothetical protein
VNEPALPLLCNLEVERGLWCDTCMLPSAAIASAMTFIDGQPQGVHRWWACYECFESRDC